VIEQVMLFSLGFLVAALLALAIAPAFSRRAFRLATQRLEMLLPVSAREVLAGRDLLRAEFAVEQRKLEQKIEALAATRADDLAELGRRAVALAEQDAKLEALTATLADRDGEIDDLRHASKAAADELASTRAALAETSAVRDRETESARHFAQHVDALQKLCANQRVALSALEHELVHEREMRVVESVRVARLDDELSALQLERDAALARARTAPVESGRREEPQHAGAALASDDTLRREIDRLYSDLLAFHDVLDADAASRDHGASSGRSRNETSSLLRQRIGEVGAMAVRIASTGRPTAAGPDGAREPAPIATTESEG
jgi:hypothetical protein